jgi:hypothetical protein
MGRVEIRMTGNGGIKRPGGCLFQICCIGQAIKKSNRKPARPLRPLPPLFLRSEPSVALFSQNCSRPQGGTPRPAAMGDGPAYHMVSRRTGHTRSTPDRLFSPRAWCSRRGRPVHAATPRRRPQLWRLFLVQRPRPPNPLKTSPHTAPLEQNRALLLLPWVNAKNRTAPLPPCTRTRRHLQPRRHQRRTQRGPTRRLRSPGTRTPWTK